MPFRMRSSKYRHVYGEASKKENSFDNIRITKNQHDSSFCCANPKFIAIVIDCGGGGSFIVLPIKRTGRVDVNTPKVTGHSGPVLDIKWNPFNDQQIASCSEDATIKIWSIPEKGLTDDLKKPILDLHGHHRRVGYIEWHPSANNILLSAGFDFNVIVWNLEIESPVNIIQCHSNTIFSISWNLDGSLFATTSKDKKIRVIDPRSGKVISEGAGHQGPKASKVVFLGDTGRLFTTGFSRLSERQVGVWDANDLSAPLRLDGVDSSSGVLIPFYDHDSKVVYVAGKGDGNIRYYEIVQEKPYCYYLNQYISPSPQRGLGTFTKRGVDPSRCEVMRFYKLHNTKNIVEPISMIVPRKAEMFHEDIYPPTASGLPALSASEWMNGENRPPVLRSFTDGANLRGVHNHLITNFKKIDRSPPDGSMSTLYHESSKSEPNVRRHIISKDQVDLNQRNILEENTFQGDSTKVSSPKEKQYTTESRMPNIDSRTPPLHDDISDNQSRPQADDGDLPASELILRSRSTSVKDMVRRSEEKNILLLENVPQERYHGRQSSTPTSPREDEDLKNSPILTEPELRKAYFKQLEEINSLKEQITLKDKRIRLLEQENALLKGENHEESNC